MWKRNLFFLPYRALRFEESEQTYACIYKEFVGVPYFFFYNIATLETSWFNPGMEEYQKWQDWAAWQEKAAQELIAAEG